MVELTVTIRAEKAIKGIIMVGGIGGDFDTTAKNLYPRLCTDLKENGISSLRVSFRYPTELTEAVIDVLVGLEFLKAEDIRTFGLIGHSFGGAVVVQAAFNEKSVKTVVTLATQSYGVSSISLLSESTSVLLIHGRQTKLCLLAVQYTRIIWHTSRKKSRFMKMRDMV